MNTSSTMAFQQFTFSGVDAEKFLQGQVTVNVQQLTDHHYQTTAICDLKGRIQFGLWLKRLSDEQFIIVISQDLADDFQAHIKKYAAFSKATLTVSTPIYPAIVDSQATFSDDEKQSVSLAQWQLTAIQHGQAWITQDSRHLFQPQELRLHQQGGVHYDKGCYLGQEIIARLWFKAQPKHWLHLIQGQGECPSTGEQLDKDIQIVNAVEYAEGWLALVVAKPTALEASAYHTLALPPALQGEIGRPKN